MNRLQQRKSSYKFCLKKYLKRNNHEKRAALIGLIYIQNFIILHTPDSTFLRWRILEAALAALGGISEAILEYIDDEEMSSRPKPIDINPFLSDVVPSLLSLAGTEHRCSTRIVSLKPSHRVPVSAGAKLCLRKSILSVVACRLGKSVLRCCCQCY